MKFNELQHIQKPQPEPDTYEAGMAQNQLLKIGTHAVRLHNMLDDGQEMESWVAKKIDLASNYVKSVHGYTAGSEAGAYDDDGMSEMKRMPKGTGTMQGVKEGTLINSDAQRLANEIMGLLIRNKEYFEKNDSEKAYMIMQYAKKLKKFTKADDRSSRQQEESAVQEDAGEGHMSKSQLYATAKMAIELIDMIKKGDDLEGWVQTKLNLAADYLQAVYHYEDYQKLNPYREDLDGQLMQKHAGVIQKNLDEILARETKTADVDTKPGMMRILKKRVNEVEKEIAKENRKETNESGILYRAGVKKYGKAGMTAIQSAAGKGANHEELGKIKDKHLKDDEALDEGIKEWGKRLAMAGVIVAGLAGVNSINNAIDNSVPAITAMNTALEMAQDSNNTELAKMIEKDLSDAKIRLSSGKDLSHVADMQEKYAKFMKTEGMAYESKLAVQLNQQLK